MKKQTTQKSKTQTPKVISHEVMRLLHLRGATVPSGFIVR